jgi:hypothetical protein
VAEEDKLKQKEDFVDVVAAEEGGAGGGCQHCFLCRRQQPEKVPKIHHTVGERIHAVCKLLLLPLEEVDPTHRICGPCDNALQVHELAVVPRKFTEWTEAARNAAVGAIDSSLAVNVKGKEEEEEEEEGKEEAEEEEMDEDAIYFAHVFDPNVMKDAADAHDAFINQGVAAEKVKGAAAGKKRKGAAVGGAAAKKKKLNVAAAEEKSAAEKKSAAKTKQRKGAAAKKKEAEHVLENTFADL